MKIFITGATGYLGFAVASALAAKGHQVFGLVRSEEKAKQIAAAEICPIIGSMNDPNSYVSTVLACEVSIHCAAEMSENFHALDRKTIDILLKTTSEVNLKRKIIYTSGVWQYGNTGYHAVNEADALNPPQLVKPRQETESRVLNANTTNLSTLVIRPGCVYGGKGGMPGEWFESALTGNTKIIGDGHNRWAMVHVQDLADLYVKIAESNVQNEIFNATDHGRFSILECALAVNRLINNNDNIHIVDKKEALKSMGDLAECLMLDQHVDSSKANRLLNWQPRHNGFVDGVERYFTAWKAMR